MTAYHVTLNGLEEVAVGAYLTINGERRRVIAYAIEPASEDDEQLDVKAGDPITTVELAPAE